MRIEITISQFNAACQSHRGYRRSFDRIRPNQTHHFRAFNIFREGELHDILLTVKVKVKVKVKLKLKVMLKVKVKVKIKVKVKVKVKVKQSRHRPGVAQSVPGS
jgi:hypothetical protein